MIRILLFLISLQAVSAFAVEIASRITDRKIVESLAELRAGQKALEENRFTFYSDAGENGSAF